MIAHTSIPSSPQTHTNTHTHLLANGRLLAACLQLKQLVLRRRVQLLHCLQARLGRRQAVRKLSLARL